jgi:aminotransferase class III
VWLEDQFGDQLAGPTGTNSVEVALKLARKITGRDSVINFTNAFHGTTLGSLSVSGDSVNRGGASIPLVRAIPTCGEPLGKAFRRTVNPAQASSPYAGLPADLPTAPSQLGDHSLLDHCVYRLLDSSRSEAALISHRDTPLRIVRC